MNATLKSRFTQPHFAARAVCWLAVVLMISLICALSAAQAAAAKALGESAQAEAVLRIASADEVSTAHVKAQAALDQVLRHLDSLPEGAILRATLHIDALEQLLRHSPSAEVLDEDVLQALRIKRPGGLEPLLRELRAAVETWQSLTTFDEAARIQAIERWRRVAQLSSADVADIEAEAGLRADFAALALLHRLDRELDQVRARLALPNQIVAVNAVYLKTLGARRFEAPINVRERRDGTLLTARGSLPLRTRLELPQDERRATIQLDVGAQGCVKLTACRGKLFVAANSEVRLDGAQRYQLTADGVSPSDPDIDLGSRTHLVGVDVDTRVGSRLAERVIGKVAARKLPDADRRAMRAAKPALEERVAKECEKIADRINGLFHQLYVGPFLAFDVDPAIHFRSGPSGIVGTATYARHDQLGALVPPPQPRVPAEQLSYVVSLHESAINNLVDQWSGRRLDEATFWMILNDEFKFHSVEVESLPPGRVPAVFQLGDRLPVVLRLRNSGLEVTLRLLPAAVDSTGAASEAATVQVRYELSAGADGIQLVRAGEIAVEPATSTLDRAQLSRFFPTRLTPRTRFRNENQPQRQMVRELLLENGWLVLGVGPAPAEAKAKREVSRP